MIILLFILLMFGQPLSAQSSCALSEPFSNGMPSDMNIQYGRSAGRPSAYYRGTTHATPDGQRYGLVSSYFAKQKQYTYSSGYNGTSTLANYGQSVNRKNTNNNVQAANYSQNYTSLSQSSLPQISRRKKSTDYAQYSEVEYQNESRPIVGIDKKDVSQGGLLDWIVYALGGDPANGGYVVNDDGELIKITNEDWEAYNNDPTYRELIDSGEVIKYDDAQERYPELFAPLSFDVYAILFFLLMCAGYVCYKRSNLLASECKNVA